MVGGTYTDGDSTRDRREVPMGEKPSVICYGAEWCGDTRRSRALMEAHGVDYEWHEIDENENAMDTVIHYAGKRKIPVIVFDDGSHLVEPSDEELGAKLGLR